MLHHTPQGSLDPEILSRACDARDARFDGLFFVGITTTRIYCRPVCPARISYPERRRFFTSAAAAEEAGYRPCLRCRPELAPGRAEMDVVPQLAGRAARRIAAGALNGHSVGELASELGVSERHLRRAFERELGVSPLQLALTHRLLLAKRLLADTPLSVTRIAYASGFQSLRRFNTVFRQQYRMPPSALRRARAERTTGNVTGDVEMLRLTLAYRAPLAWDALLGCLERDAIPGVDYVEGRRYARTVDLDGRHGVIFVEDEECVRGDTHLTVDVSLSLVPVLMPLLARLRHLFDLDAEPAVIDAHLAAHGLAAAVRRRPGMRIPGALGGFEVALRALVGGWPHRHSAANHVGARVVAAIGVADGTGPTRLRWLLPTAEQVAAAGAKQLHDLGMTRGRAETLAAIARRVVDGTLRLDIGHDPEAMRRELMTVEGVNEPLAATIVMRALSWPDAFSFRDDISAKWRPWGAYALLHLWLDEDVFPFRIDRVFDSPSAA